MPAMGYGLTIFFALLIGAILGVFWMVSFLSQRIDVLLLIRATDYWAALR
jgi:hypothetical protein